MDRVNRPYKIGMLNLLKDWAKNDGRFPGIGAKCSQTRRNCSLSLQKILKN